MGFQGKMETLLSPGKVNLPPFQPKDSMTESFYDIQNICCKSERKFPALPPHATLHLPKITSQILVHLLSLQQSKSEKLGLV